MNFINNCSNRKLQLRRGNATIEYAILLSLIALGTTGTVAILGRHTQRLFNEVHSAIASSEKSEASRDSVGPARQLVFPGRFVGHGAITTDG